MKELEWRADTKSDFAGWPLKAGVRAKFLAALRDLQSGENECPGVKWLAGFDVRVAEIKISGYRLTVTCEIGNRVYVLTAFKKDSAVGKQTRKHEIDLIKTRVKNLKTEHSPTAPKVRIH